MFGFRSDSEGDESDRTITAKPVGLDARLASNSLARSKLSTAAPTSLQSPVASSPCSSVDDGSLNNDTRSFYGSDAGTVFSEDSCPSLADSNDTTFYTNSTRNSTSSTSSIRGNRNRYPSILIPRGSWQEETVIKEMSLAMSPAQKIMLSPQALSTLPQHVPSLNAPPSFGEASSMGSNSPCIPAMCSAPVTPDLQSLVPTEGESWGTVQQRIETPLEIADDEHNSVVLSSRDSRAQSDRASTGYSTDWSDIVVRFPEIPGATPHEHTPVSPEIGFLKRLRQEPSDHGVQLPTDALKLLQHLTKSYSPSDVSYRSDASPPRVEMRERSDAGDRPKSAVMPSPMSDYSFSQLSIPSPGGFFSSLQASSRATWCLPVRSQTPSAPSSAIAANFYNIPFGRSSDTVETVVEVPDSAATDGPPTARQPSFEVPAEYREDEFRGEDEDLYGASHRSQATTQKSSSPELGHEYEDMYQQELTQAAKANIDRTSDWLSAQTTYMSALRESNPRNDPAQYIPQTPCPKQEEENDQSEESPARKAVRFLEEAIRMSNLVKEDGNKPAREPTPRDPVFLEAFKYSVGHKGRQDAFLQASARIERIASNRVALPVEHVRSLLNTHTTENIQTHNRPKYRGPFSQNPRATGNFQRTPEQVLFAEAERKQLAMDHILPAVWMTEAQRKVLYKGRLFACPPTTEYLSRSTGPTKKTIHVLDLAGAATGSWAWAAAHQWPAVSFVTVQNKAQSQLASQWPVSSNGEAKKVIKPENPANHRVAVVPELWKLPFADNHFDIISTRTLHMFVRSRPVPEVPSINEWDLVLKECMRILKPGGIFDYALLDSHIANNNTDNRGGHSRDNSAEGMASISPTAAVGQGLTSPLPTSTFGMSGAQVNPAVFNFGRELKKRGFDADGGCGKLAERLESTGFIKHKSQAVGLPLGRTGPTQDNVLGSCEQVESRAPTPASNSSKSTSTGLQRSKVGSVSAANGRSRTPFPPAPRPISEVSSISRIIEQYANVEAVHGPVGSTADVSDLSGLLGTMMWEEWLVRHRLELLHSKSRQDAGQDKTVDATYEAANLLHGVNDILATGYAKGGCFHVVIGWARKPSKNPVQKSTPAAAPAQRQNQQQPSVVQGNTSVTPTYKPKKQTSVLDTYRARAAARARENPAYESHPSDKTPITAIITTPGGAPAHYYGRGFVAATPIEYKRHPLSLDTNVGLGHGPQFTQSAVDRGEVGTIPMVIIE